MRFLRALLIACLACLPQSAQDTLLTSQAAAVSSFYATALALKEPGIPSEADQKTLAPHLSRSLRRLLAKAGKAEVDYQRKTKGTVPALVESFLFYSLFEGADALGSIEPDGADAFLVELTYGTGDQAVRWKDRVHLVRERRRWVIDDIELKGAWDFGPKGRVRDILTETIARSRETIAE